MTTTTTSTNAVMSTTTTWRLGLTPEHLVLKWKILLQQAWDTIPTTIQRAVCYIANPALSQRFKTNDRMLQYNCILHLVFTNTMKASIKSTRQNTHAQIYCTKFQWMQAYPMHNELQAHYTLSTMFKDVGVPNKMVMDNAETQVHGKFWKKLREVDWQVRSVEPHAILQLCWFSNSRTKERNRTQNDCK